MFEIGFWELALLFAVALVVLGPEKLPRVAAQIGRYAGQARRMARTLSAQVRDELEAEEFRARQAEQRRSAATAAPPGDGVGEPAAADTAPSAPAGETPAAATEADPPAGAPAGSQQELELGADTVDGAPPAAPRWSRPGVSDLIPDGERSADAETRRKA